MAQSIKAGTIITNTKGDSLDVDTMVIFIEGKHPAGQCRDLEGYFALSPQQCTEVLNLSKEA